MFQFGEDAVQAAMTVMSDQTLSHVGLYDFVQHDTSGAALRRFGRFCKPGKSGFALAAYHVPSYRQNPFACEMVEEDLAEVTDTRWDSNMILLPVKWHSLVDPLSLQLSEAIARSPQMAMMDPDVAQALLRFPSVTIEPMEFGSPIGEAEQLSMTPFNTMYVWHLTPVSEDEAGVFRLAYDAAVSQVNAMPYLAYDVCCNGNDPADEMVDEVIFDEWVKSGGTPVCDGAQDDDVVVLGDLRKFRVCMCCGYHELRHFILETEFPTVFEYMTLIQSSLGELYYSRWNEATKWMSAGLRSAHDIAHLDAIDARSDAWLSWWESHSWPERCSGLGNELPLALERFERFASSA